MVVWVEEEVADALEFEKNEKFKCESVRRTNHRIRKQIAEGEPWKKEVKNDGWIGGRDRKDTESQHPIGKASEHNVNDVFDHNVHFVLGGYPTTLQQTKS